MNIPLRNKQKQIVGYTIIDEDDYEKVNKYKWYLFKNKYASGKVNGKTIQLHQYIFGQVKQGNVIDHINNNGLDNRKNNLREATNSQNSQNRAKKEGCSSKYIGVIKRGKYWRAKCGDEYLGKYISEEHAAQAYDKAALIIFGDKAKINGVIMPDEGKIENKQRELPKGICLRPSGKYEVSIYFNGKNHYLNCYNTIEEANEVYQKAKKQSEEIQEELLLKQPITKNKNAVCIILTKKNEEILVDENLWYSLTKNGSWCINNSGYAQSSEGVLMHRLIINVKSNEIVDHKNHNRLDNRIENLSITTPSANAHNRTKKHNASSKYYGVYKTKNNTYRSYVKRIYLGTYKDEIMAAQAYNCKAKELYGDNANLNNI
jgi:AP2-like factor (euAP2 lineage)